MPWILHAGTLDFVAVDLYFRMFGAYSGCCSRISHSFSHDRGAGAEKTMMSTVDGGSHMDAVELNEHIIWKNSS